MTHDRFGNPHAPGLPYAHGEHIRSSRDDHAKLHHAWDLIAERARDGGLREIYNFSGLERRFEAAAEDLALLDDELAPAFMVERLNALALDHLGGEAAAHDILVFNRQTAAVITATLALVEPGETVIGVSPTYSHPCVVRAAKRAGANFVDTVGLAQFESVLGESDNVALVSLTRLTVSYEILNVKEIERIIDLAHRRGAKVLVDDASGARVGPAVFDQPRMLELGVDVGSTGLDKYGTVGPRLGSWGVSESSSPTFAPSPSSSASRPGRCSTRRWSVRSSNTIRPACGRWWQPPRRWLGRSRNGSATGSAKRR